MEPIPDDLHQQVKKLIEKKQFEQAEELCKQFLQENPESDEGYSVLTEIYQASGNWIGGLDAFKKANTLNPQNPRAHYFYAKLLLDQGLYEDALSEFNLVEKIDPSFKTNLQLDLGKAYGDAGDYNNQIKAFNRAIAQGDHVAEAYKGLGQAYSKLKNLSEAIRCFNKAIELSPEDSENYYLIGKIYQTLKKNDDALYAFEKAVEYRSDYEEAYKELVPFYSAAANWKKAAAAMKRLHQDSGTAYYFSELGFYLQKSGEYGQSIDAYKKAVMLEPDESSHYFNLGIVYRLNKDWKNAIESYLKATELSPKEADYYYGLSFAYCSNHQIEEAKAAANESLKLGNKKAWELVDFISKSQCLG